MLLAAIRVFARTCREPEGGRRQRSRWTAMNLNNVGPSARVDEQISDLDDLGLPFSLFGAALQVGEVTLRWSTSPTAPHHCPVFS